MTSIEQRRRFADTLGDRVKGFAGGQLRMAGGPAPSMIEPQVEAKPRPRVATPDYTSSARLEFEQLKAAAGSTPERRYTQAEVDQLGRKGHAYRHPDGTFAFPVANRTDVVHAVMAVGRAAASQRPAIRRFIMRRARELGCSDVIPAAWAADGSLR